MGELLFEWPFAPLPFVFVLIGGLDRCEECDRPSKNAADYLHRPSAGRNRRDPDRETEWMKVEKQYPAPRTRAPA